MAFTKTVAFVNDIDSIHDGKIYITIQDSDAAVGPFNVFISVASPSNPSYYVSTNPTPEVVLPDNSIVAWSVDIPIVAGEYESGSYDITIEIEGQETNTGSYTYLPVVSPGSSESDVVVLDYKLKCDKKQLILTDSTDNTGYFLGSPPRTFVINYPPDSEEDSITVLSSITTTVDIKEINGTYKVSLTLRRQKLSQTSNTIVFVINEVISKEERINVNCLYELLKLKCLYFEKVRNYVEMLSYGINCDKDETLDLICNLNSLITMYGWCDNAELSCLTTNIVNKNYDRCNVALTRCEEKEDYYECEEDCI